MTTITNTQEAGRPGQPQNAIGLPDGRTLEAGASLEYKDWDKIKDRPVIKHYVDTGLIKVSKGKAAEPDETDEQRTAREAKEQQEQIERENAEVAQREAAAATKATTNTGGRNSR